MPSIKDQPTIIALAKEYCSNGRNKTEAMVTIGYSRHYADGGRGQGMVYGNDRVKAAIAEVDAGNAAEAGYTVEQCQKEYEQARQLGISLNQPSAVVSAVTGKARLYGFDKDNQVNDDQAREIDASKADQARQLIRLQRETA